MQEKEIVDMLQNYQLLKKADTKIVVVFLLHSCVNAGMVAASTIMSSPCR